MDVVITGVAWVDEAHVTPTILHAYTYHHPHELTSFKTYVYSKGRYGFPIGNKQKFLALFPKANLIDKRIAPHTNKAITLTGLTLRPYQETLLVEILEFFESGGTTFNLSGKPSSGKSVLIAAILASLNIKTLVIAHMTLLTTQLFKELSAATDANITTLDDKHLELKDVNIATSQFISGRPELWREIKHNIGCIIVDESESAGALTMLRILQRAHAKYRIFVSATFSRSVDNRTEALMDLSGGTIFELVNPDIIVPSVMMVYCDEQYPRFISKHTTVKRRQKFFRQDSIADKVEFLVKKSLVKNRHILIAVNIQEFQEKLYERLSGYTTVGILNSQTSKSARDDILQKFDSGQIKVIIGAAVLNAGLSMPRVSTIIRVAFVSSKEKNVQLVGRALRSFPGKDGAFIFDLVFRGQNPYGRIQAYKQNGYKVTRHTWSQLEQALERQIVDK